MFRGQFQTPQEISAAKTSHEKLIEFLEEKGWKEIVCAAGNDRLNFCQINIGDTEVKEIKEILKFNSTIPWLYFNTNNISDDGAKELADMLKFNPTFTLLSLTSNKIGYIGAGRLAEALKDNHALKILYLGGNNISDVGAKAIATMLKYNSTLTTLNLSHNNIGNNGAKIIATMLKDNFTLTTLYLNGNNIDDTGAKEMVAILEDNFTLTALYPKHTNINDSGVKEIDKYIQRNKNLYEENNNKAVKLKPVNNLIDINIQPKEDNNMATIIETKLMVFKELILRINTILENSNNNKKAKIQKIMSKIEEGVKNFTDIENIEFITQKLNKLIDSKIITSARVKVIKEKMYDKLKQQINLEKDICATKLVATHKVIEQIHIKLEEINIKNKPSKDNIDEIKVRLQNLTNKGNIEEISQMIEKYSMKLKLTKARIGLINEKIDDLIDKEVGTEYNIPNNINSDLNNYSQELLGIV